MMMKVENAKPWPAMQRFDFLVRTRLITDDEAAQRVKALATEETPAHAAAQYALRELTGHNPANPTAVAWRQLLKMASP